MFFREYNVEDRSKVELVSGVHGKYMCSFRGKSVSVCTCVTDTCVSGRLSQEREVKSWIRFSSNSICEILL